MFRGGLGWLDRFVAVLLAMTVIDEGQIS